MVRQAWKTMVTGRPGPVVLDVPFDMFNEPPRGDATTRGMEREHLVPLRRRSGRRDQGGRHADGGERPVILVGQGVRYGGAAEELRRLRKSCGSRSRRPRAGSARCSDHPLALGLVARNGPYQANHAARQADVLLALGVRFDDRTSSSWIRATRSPFRRPS